MDKSLKNCARVFADLDALSHAAAAECERAAMKAVKERGRCLISLSGGHTPERTYDLWADEYRERMPWGKIHFFWGDERFVPEDDASSNYRMAKENLLARVPVPATNVHPMKTNFATAEEAAQAYEATLRTFFGDAGPTFDVLFLGVGGEGHTASLFPHSPALTEQKRWVVGVRAPAEPPVRISLTFPVMRRARETYFLVAGAEKQEIVRTLRENWSEAEQKLPAAMLKPEGDVIWFLDREADGK